MRKILPILCMLALSLPVHAETPSWQSWSETLFDNAQKQNKLVLLDLEAVWCHWCHVMDQKTYADPKVAALLKERFIAVKVDQDSRPDLANRYEDYGWPATIIFNAKGEELVKRSGYIEAGEMLALLKKLAAKPLAEAEAANKKITTYAEKPTLSAALKQELFNKHIEGYDTKYGAWGTGHKFLDWDSVEYSLARAQEGNAQGRQMADQTLLAQLNLLDPVWGGVYQYSTQGDWQHKHFEKIMQMQAENMRIYALGYLCLKDSKFLDAAKDIEKYLRTFLLSPQGAFYTSQDADLKPGEHSQEYFDLSDGERRKKGIPKIDTHIYARENGWAINGLLALYGATADKTYLTEALQASDWIIKNRALTGGGFKHGEASDGIYLGDTLAMGRAFLSFYQVTGDRNWLKKAELAADFIGQNFAPKPGQAGYVSSIPDKAMPAAEALLEENIALARFANLLERYTGNKKYKEMAESSMRYLATPEVARKRRILVAGILLADRELAAAPAHITIVGAKEDPQALALFQAANQCPFVYKRIDWCDPKEGPMPNPDTDYPLMKKAAAFVCVNQRCSLPVYDPLSLFNMVKKMTEQKTENN
ncbi:MAG: DUF255 domain-containing protein [Candidatus Obscuribacterales bacterium]|nr:DUF255 domain-containing protein [Candidatus Obscuribacterales bacterium]